MKYQFILGVQLDKFLGDQFKFQSRTFSVSECESREQAENEAKDWCWEYVQKLAKARKDQKDKTLTEEMMLEFDAQIKQAKENKLKSQELRKKL